MRFFVATSLFEYRRRPNAQLIEDAREILGARGDEAVVYEEPKDDRFRVCTCDRDIHAEALRALAERVEVMSRCDGVYMSKGWAYSRDSKILRDIADEYGLVVEYERELDPPRDGE